MEVITTKSALEKSLKNKTFGGDEIIKGNKSFFMIFNEERKEYYTYIQRESCGTPEGVVVLEMQKLKRVNYKNDFN
jgi:hypothetical protein